MKENYDDIDELIGKCLAEEASPEEQEMLDRWLAQDTANQVHFDQCKTLFEKSSSLGEWQTFDTDAAWVKVKRKINGDEKGGNPFLRIWLAAASVILLMGASYIIYQWYDTPKKVVALRTESVARQDTLPDGTKAFLNKETLLSYEYVPSRKKRVVKLEGEAFFEIEERKEQQFTVETNGLIIEDIGTTFNVKGYSRDSVVQVFVETGEVAMYTDNDPGIRILSGETGEYNKLTRKFSKVRNQDENITAYKSREFQFEATTLGELVNTINDVYDRKLGLSNEGLSNCRITVSFNDESIDVIAEIIAETLKLTLTKTDREILLDGVCSE